MPRLAPKLLELNPVEKEELEKILARHSTSQQVVKRVRIIILASEGKNHGQNDKMATPFKWTYQGKVLTA